jgi:hypothetical protein
MSGSRRKPGPLGPFVEGYRAWLLGRSYSPSAVIRSLIALGHLGRWMEREALAVDQLTAGAVSAFLAEYRSDRGRLPTRACGRRWSICAPRRPFLPSHPRWSSRLTSWSASIAGGCLASAGWRRSRPAATVTARRGIARSSSA